MCWEGNECLKGGKREREENIITAFGVLQSELTEKEKEEWFSLIILENTKRNIMHDV